MGRIRRDGLKSLALKATTLTPEAYAWLGAVVHVLSGRTSRSAVSVPLSTRSRSRRQHEDFQTRFTRPHANRWA